MTSPTSVGADRAKIIDQDMDLVSDHSIRSQYQICDITSYEPTADDYAALEQWRNEYGLNDNLGSDNPYNIPRYNMMNNYPRLSSWPVLGKMLMTKYGKVYYIVCAPKNKKYDGKKCLIDHIRKKIGKYWTEVIITREIRSTKIHYNVLVRSDNELKTKLHLTQDSRFFYYVQEVPDTFSNIKTVHEYITKEARERYFMCLKKPIDIYSCVYNPRGSNFHYYNDISQ